MDIHDGGSMNSSTLHLVRCQFLHHIWGCEKCGKLTILPDQLCEEALSMYGEILAWSDIEKEYKRETGEFPTWTEPDQKGIANLLVSFWPGTN